MNDVIIVGGGPAGLTAAIYCARRGLKTTVITKDIGGQITRTDVIENYPGFEAISGSELAKKFFDQAKKFGAEILFDEVKKITKKDDAFYAQTLRKEITAKSVILAFGKKPRELGVPGEEKLKGRGVSYCATCDAPFYKEKILTITGGGNSAAEATILASKIAKKVYLIYRGSELKAEKIMVDEIKKSANVEILYNEEIIKINGDQKVESLDLKSGKNIATDGLIIEIGFIIDRAPVDGLVEMDKANQVIVDKTQMTSVPGIFAAGDLTQTLVKQVVVSAGEGAKSALAAYDYIQKKEGKKGILSDWH